jgi:hypothetical protein
MRVRRVLDKLLLRQLLLGCHEVVQPTGNAFGKVWHCPILDLFDAYKVGGGKGRANSVSSNVPLASVEGIMALLGILPVCMVRRFNHFTCLGLSILPISNRVYGCFMDLSWLRVYTVEKV